MLYYHLGEATPPEENVDPVDVTAVQSDWVGAFCGSVLETEEVIGHLRWAGHLTGTVQAKHQQIHHQAVVLHDERGKLETPDDAVRVGVVHVLREWRRGGEKHLAVKLISEYVIANEKKKEISHL